MTIPPAVQAEIDRLMDRASYPDRKGLTDLAALAVRETARGCARIATEIDDKDVQYGMLIAARNRAETAEAKVLELITAGEVSEARVETAESRLTPEALRAVLTDDTIAQIARAITGFHVYPDAHQCDAGRGLIIRAITGGSET